MKRVKYISLALHIFSKIAAILFLVVGFYALAVFLLNKAGFEGAPIEIQNGAFTIFYPFTRAAFLLGDYTTQYMLITLFVILLYGIFLWLLSGVFYAFMQVKIFVTANMDRLRRFYLFNLYVPILCLVCLVFFRQDVGDALIIIFLHVMLSVFIFFMRTIFQQGLVLQEEQDQTL